jgi:hypothetical protein
VYEFRSKPGWCPALVSGVNASGWSQIGRVSVM